jgi:cytidyltransferase-like protein
MLDITPKTVLIFGVFDMLHPGHVYFIDQATSLGVDLHINLATDEYVKKYKNKNTVHGYEERKKTIQHFYPKAFIHKGDVNMGDWSIFKKINPDIVALGYDQNMLKKALIESGFVDSLELVDIPSFNPEIYSTTNLTK